MPKLKKDSKLLASAIVVALMGLVLLLIAYTASSSFSPFKYAITIDAGSTHSKAILFKWRADKRNDTGVIEQVQTCHISRGIATYAEDRINGAANELMACIEQLASHLDRATSLEHTFVYLGATAGMRMLNLTDPSATTEVFEAIKARFVQSGLQTRRVSIITGKEEGLFAWVAVNYLSGNFFRHSSAQTTGNTFGVLDMGGASAQIAHQVNDHADTEKDSVHIRLYGTNYTVHTYSNFCFGTEQALKRYLKLTMQRHLDSNRNSSQIEAPCMPKGYRLEASKIETDNVCTRSREGNQLINTTTGELTPNIVFVGTSEYEKCNQIVNQIVDPNVCDSIFRFCFEQTTHPKEGTFFAISAYYYLTDVLNLKDKYNKISFDDYVKETRHICESSKEELKHRKRLNEKFINKYCFQLLYLHSTLTKVYHFDEKTWPNLRFTSSIDGNYLGWVLGFMIAESNSIPSEIPISDFLLDTNLYLIPAILLLLVLTISVTICLWRRLRPSNRTNSLSLSMSQVA